MGFMKNVVVVTFSGNLSKLKGDVEFGYFEVKRKPRFLFWLLILEMIRAVQHWFTCDHFDTASWNLLKKLSSKKQALHPVFFVKQHFLRGQFSFLCSNKTGFGVCLASKLELVFVSTIWTACFSKSWLTLKCLHDVVVYGICSFTWSLAYACSFM